MPNKKDKPSILVVGPDSWSVEDLQELKQRLEGLCSLTTFCDSGELTLSDVLHALNGKKKFVLVMGEPPNSWGHRNGGKLAVAAERAGVETYTLGAVSVQQAATFVRDLRL
jgi:hypothetical protein